MTHFKYPPQTVLGCLSKYWFSCCSALLLSVSWFKYSEFCYFSSKSEFTSDAPLFSLCTVVYVPVQGARHGCWCVIPSDIIVLSIYNISNAWITHDCKCDIRCLSLKWDFFLSLLYLFYLICSWIHSYEWKQNMTLVPYSDIMLL